MAEEEVGFWEAFISKSASSFDVASWIGSTIVFWLVLLPLLKIYWKNRAIVKGTSRLIRSGEKAVSIPCGWWSFPLGDSTEYSEDCVMKAGKLEESHPRGSLFQWLGTTPVLMLLDPKDMKDFFSGKSRKHNSRSGLDQFPLCMQRLVSNSICDVEGPRWQEVHSVVAPFFGRSAVVRLRPMMEAQMKLTIDDIQNSTTGMVAFKLDIHKLFRNVVARTVLHMLAFNTPSESSLSLGTDGSKVEDEMEEYVDALVELLGYASETQVLHTPFLNTASFLPQIKRANALVEAVAQTGRAFLSTYTSHFLTSTPSFLSGADGLPTSSSTVIIALSEAFDADIVLANVHAFMLCAIDPTASLMSYVLHLLSCNKGEYDHLLEELDVKNVYLTREKKKAKDSDSNKQDVKKKNKSKKNKRNDMKATTNTNQRQQAEGQHGGGEEAVAGNDTKTTLGKVESVFEDEWEKAVLDKADESNCIRPKKSFFLAVVNETLRMYPPQAILPSRVVHEAAQIGDFAMAKGVSVSTSPLLVHRRSALWSDPSIFFPQRMLDKAIPECFEECFFIPFGVGERSCLGQAMVYEFVSCALPLFLREIKILNPSEFAGNAGAPRYDVYSTLQPSHGKLVIALAFRNKTAA
eukprot:m.13917 g.13917  ORF g.13917 m.13917 type:complete len:633 (-) comp4221_c0_seq1:169-2067(-)